MAGDAEKLGLRYDFDAVIFQRGFKRQPDIPVHLRQDRATPLENRHLRAEPGKELTQLECYRPCPQYQQRSWLRTQVQNRIAREEIYVRETRDSDLGRAGAGCNNKGARGEPGAFYVNFMRRAKPTTRFVKRKGGVAKLLDPVISELTNQPIFSIHDRRQICTGRHRGKSELLCAPEESRDFGGTQDSLCRHAATENAEPSQGALIYNRDVSAG